MSCKVAIFVCVTMLLAAETVVCKPKPWPMFEGTPINLLDIEWPTPPAPESESVEPGMPFTPPIIPPVSAKRIVEPEPMTTPNTPPAPASATRSVEPEPATTPITPPAPATAKRSMEPETPTKPITPPAPATATRSAEPGPQTTPYTPPTPASNSGEPAASTRITPPTPITPQTATVTMPTPITLPTAQTTTAPTPITPPTPPTPGVVTATSVVPTEKRQLRDIIYILAAILIVTTAIFVVQVTKALIGKSNKSYYGNISPIYHEINSMHPVKM